MKVHSYLHVAIVGSVLGCSTLTQRPDGDSFASESIVLTITKAVPTDHYRVAGILSERAYLSGKGSDSRKAEISYLPPLVMGPDKWVEILAGSTNTPKEYRADVRIGSETHQIVHQAGLLFRVKLTVLDTSVVRAQGVISLATENGGEGTEHKVFPFLCDCTLGEVTIIYSKESGSASAGGDVNEVENAAPE